MENRPDRLFISAPHKSAGKTTLTLGLARALKKRLGRVQCFKKGPDYIDPMWHRQATGLDSYNLDPFLMEEGVILESFLERSAGASLSLIEGNHGLHDGLDRAGSNSSAGLARLLKAPVLLVIDSTGMNRAAAAMVLGQIKMEPRARIGGVILNRVKSKRQIDKQIAAIEEYCGVPVLGAIPVEREAQIGERHLGLTTTEEMEQAETVIEKAAKLIEEHCDLERILELARSAEPLERMDGEPPEAELAETQAETERVAIGVIRDRAFCFYYPENLEALERAGARLVMLDSMADREIPPLDGLYIGGGFPESFLEEIQANRGFREELGRRIKAGLPAYLECGGMIYAAEEVEHQGANYRMLGVIPARVKFQKKPIGYGYMELNPKEGHWLSGTGPLKGHEFHYSWLEEKKELPKLFEVQRGVGLGAKQDGILLDNLTASYAHLHALSSKDWARRFVGFVKQRSSKD